MANTQGDKSGTFSAEDAAGREQAGALYRFRTIGERNFTANDALDILHSLRFSLHREADRLARLAVWSECNQIRGAVSVTAGLKAAVDSPNGLRPVLWEPDIMMASAANLETFQGENPDDVFRVQDTQRAELWIPARPMLWLNQGMDLSASEEPGLSEEEQWERRRKIHDEWWELPYPCQPLGVILLPSQNLYATTTFGGRHIPAGSLGTLAVLLFAPTSEKSGHQNLSLSITPEGLRGPALVLRPMEIAWNGVPAQGFYTQLMAMRWFMDQPFTESAKAPAKAEKHREIESLQKKAGMKPHTGPVSLITLRQKPAVESDPDGAEEGEAPSGDARYAGWWFVRGSVQWRRHGPGRTERRRVWVNGYVKNAKAQSEGKPFIGQTQVARVRR